MKYILELKEGDRSSDSIARVLRLSQDGFGSVEAAWTVVESSFPNARYMSPFGATHDLITKRGTCEIFVVNRSGSEPAHAKFQLSITADPQGSESEAKKVEATIPGQYHLN